MLCAYLGDKYFWESVYIGSNSMASQWLHNTVKADEVDLSFDFAGLPVWNCALR